MNFNDRTWAEVDLDAIEYNYRMMRAALPRGARICCVVKADAYGHGGGRVASLLESLGADFFAVSNLDEALALRRADITSKILVLGYTPPNRAIELKEYGISQCVYSTEYANALASYASEGGFKLSVHMKIDTGMGRIGFVFRHSADESIEELSDACAHSCFILEGIFTHFPTADEADTSKPEPQFRRFCEVTDELEKRGFSFAIKHCNNSAGSMSHPEFALDMVRLGIVLYGAHPSNKMNTHLIPRPTISLKTVVSNVKTVRKGDSIGYGAAYIAPKDMRVATLTIGYADGIRRANSDNGTPILINGQLCRIVGRICMDQLMVEVDRVENIAIGDEVTVFGNGGISLSQFAEYNQTIAYEILSQIGARVPRFYLRNGRRL